MTAKITCAGCTHAYADSALFCPNCGRPKVREFGGDALLGKVLGERFQVQELLGQGGSGTIYRAEHITLRRRVAIKVLHNELSRDDLAVERFRREATTVAEIDNEHIVEIHDFGRTPDGRLYLAMELLEGETLDAVLAREQTLSVERVADILIQLGEALMEAHAIGYVHRDLRPRNVYLAVRRGKANFVKLLDFGLSKLVETDASAASTSLGMTFGDPRYMSPEQARGDRIDRRADIYQLGCVAYEMLTGAPPFSGSRVFDILTKQVTEAPQPLPARRRDVPLWMEAAVTKMLAKDPENRFATTTRMVEALRRGLETGEVMEDEIARRRESIPPPSVSRVMHKMGLTQPADPPPSSVPPPASAVVPGAALAPAPVPAASVLPAPVPAAPAQPLASAAAPVVPAAPPAPAAPAQPLASAAASVVPAAPPAPSFNGSLTVRGHSSLEPSGPFSVAASPSPASPSPAPPSPSPASPSQPVLASPAPSAYPATPSAPVPSPIPAVASQPIPQPIPHPQTISEGLPSLVSQPVPSAIPDVASQPIPQPIPHPQSISEALPSLVSSPVSAPHAAPVPEAGSSQPVSAPHAAPTSGPSQPVAGHAPGMPDSVELLRKRTGTPRLGVPVVPGAAAPPAAASPESDPTQAPVAGVIEGPRDPISTSSVRSQRHGDEKNISQVWFEEEDELSGRTRRARKASSPSVTDLSFDDELPRGRRWGLILGALAVLLGGGIALAMTLGGGGGSSGTSTSQPVASAVPTIDAAPSTIIEPTDPAASPTATDGTGGTGTGGAAGAGSGAGAAPGSAAKPEPKAPGNAAKDPRSGGTAPKGRGELASSTAPSPPANRRPSTPSDLIPTPPEPVFRRPGGGAVTAPEPVVSPPGGGAISTPPAPKGVSGSDTPQDPYGNPEAPAGGPEKQAEFFANLGGQQLASGDAVNAATHFKKALELDARNTPATIGMGEIALRQGLFGDAIAHLQKASRLAPRSARVFTLLGEAYLALGRNPDAATNFKKALQLDPDSARARDGYNEASSRVPPPTDE